MEQQSTLEDLELMESVPATAKPASHTGITHHNMKHLFNGVYQGKTVLVTGHTGFKGSWLCLWLKQMGATVIGLSKELPSSPSHFERLALDVVDLRGNIADANVVENAVKQYQPDIIFHMAAQALVRYSYQHPTETFATNVMGTVNLLNAALATDSVRAFVNITSDKAYENKEWVWGYRENDPMGGHDPYSASKGCAELVTSSYRNSFFSKTNKLLASARAGNVIGGGDWAVDRLVPDIFKATAKGETVQIRSVHATRPWQHVLEPLSGYLLLGQRLLEGEEMAAEGWNFGPSDDNTREVGSVVKAIASSWDAVKFETTAEEKKLHEANLLKLDCSKALQKLQWFPVWPFEKTIAVTTNWYRDFYTGKGLDISQRSLQDLQAYVNDATAKKLDWTSKQKTEQ